MGFFNSMLNSLSWILIPFILFASTELFSQYSSPQLISSSGSYNINQTGSISWSLGEVTTSTLVSNDVVLTQGFQQPSISIVDQVKTIDPDLQISAYPNPTANNITIAWNSPNLENCIINLYSLKGIILKQHIVTRYQFSQTIDLTGFDSGLYILHVVNPENQVIYITLISKIN